MFIHMSAWIVGRNSKKHHCRIRKKITEGIKGSDFSFRFSKILINHSSDIDFKDFMKNYINCSAKPFYFLTCNTTLSSDSSLRFRQSFLESILKMIMTIDN